VRADEVLAAVRPGTVLVSVIGVSNELGTRQPVEAIGGLLDSRLRGNDKAGKGHNKILYHVDAVQAVVSTDLTFASTKADLFTVSAHKIGGPKGVGALVVRKGLKLVPMQAGGGHESGKRSGTENAPGIAGFGAAAQALLISREAEADRYRKHRERLLSKLPAGVKPLVSAEAPSAPHILSLECPGMENDWLILLMSREGVMIAAGSACKSGSREASEIIKALGLDDARAKSVVRVSFGHDTKEKDVDAFIDALTRSLSMGGTSRSRS
jgi:cysteine desulfurase